jgi:putative SbcD/Mre11-related phosphoesterase
MRVDPSLTTSSSVRTEVLPEVWLDSRLALWLSTERILVLADLHWGYAESHRARGNLLPRWGDDEIETRLDQLVRDYDPIEMIWLGDVVHAAEGATHAESYLGRTRVRITALAGNHDRRWRYSGEKTASRGRYFFHHGDAKHVAPTDSVEVIGHHHPAISWGDGAGAHLKLPALVTGRRRFVLPAFSPWAAGTPWSASADGEETLWAVSPHRIFALPRISTAAGLTVT